MKNTLLKKNRTFFNTLRPKEVFALSRYYGSGQIIFKVDDTFNSFTITITGIPKMKERIYRW